MSIVGQSSSYNEESPLVGQGEYKQVELKGSLDMEDPWAKVKVVKTRWKYYLPIINWLPKYTSADFCGDLSAGISLGVMIVPQAIAYASLTQLEPINMLLTAFFPLVIYCFMCTSKHMSVGPESGSAILVGQVIVAIQGNATDTPALQELARTLTFMVGILLLIMGFFRMGFVSQLLSRPALSGYVLSVAIVLIVEQLPKLFGTPVPDVDDTPFQKVGWFFMHIQESHWEIMITAFSAVVFLLLLKQWKDYHPSSRILGAMPSVLIVVVVFSVCSRIFNMEANGVPILGDLQSGFLTPSTPNVSQQNLNKLFTPAITIAMSGFINSMIVAKMFADKHHYGVSANRELIALGMCSLIGSFFGATVAFGSLPRSKVGESAGTRTPIAGLITSILVLFSLLFLLPAFYYLPKAVVAAIILWAAVALLDFGHFRFIVSVKQWGDVIVMVATTAVVLFVGIDSGILFACLTCLLLALKQTTTPSLVILGRDLTNKEWVDLNRTEKEGIPLKGSIILRLDGPLYFANADKLRDNMRRVEDYGRLHVHPSEQTQKLELKSLVFSFEYLTTLDATGLALLIEIIQQYKVRCIQVFFVGLSPENKLLFQQASIYDDLLPSHCFFRKLDDLLPVLRGESVINRIDGYSVSFAEEPIHSKSEITSSTDI